MTRLEKHAGAPGADARLQDMLDHVLERAVIVDSREIPANVVTMNSQATLVDETSGEQMTWTVVYPPNADFAAAAGSRWKYCGSNCRAKARMSASLTVTPVVS